MIRFLKNLRVLIAGTPDIPDVVKNNQTLRCIFERRSCRWFTSEELTEDETKTILEAGRFAPSTVNLQTWTFITFTRQQWQALFDRPIPFKAAFAIVVCADISRLKTLLPELHDTPHVNLSFAIFNAGLAAMNMTLAAEALGIGSVLLSETGRTGLLDCDFLQQKLGLPPGVLPLTTLVLGKRARRLPGIPPRQPWNAVVMEQRYDPAAGSRLQDWFSQMLLGFKLTHPFSSFQKQLALYRKKMAAAEKTLQATFEKLHE